MSSSYCFKSFITLCYIFKSVTHFELIFVPSVRHVEESFFFSLLRASHSWVILLIHSASLHLLIDVSGLLTFNVLTVMSGLQVFFSPLWLFGCRNVVTVSKFCVLLGFSFPGPLARIVGFYWRILSACVH